MKILFKFHLSRGIDFPFPSVLLLRSGLVKGESATKIDRDYFVYLASCVLLIRLFAKLLLLPTTAMVVNITLLHHFASHNFHIIIFIFTERKTVSSAFFISLFKAYFA